VNAVSQELFTPIASEGIVSAHGGGNSGNYFLYHGVAEDFHRTLPRIKRG
jgi:hypothetical protein